MSRLGLPDDARVLEPGCGSGLFLSAAPTAASMVGVELDPVTAGIAEKLNPDADIRAESFADTRNMGGFDAVIGNVPFADVVLHDPVYNRARLSMHNHFIGKGLEMTSPGGLVGVLTSRWTMDSHDNSAREHLAGLGELVTAVRLPAGAHRDLAGTDAITDLVVLRRHTDQPSAERPTWIDTDVVDGDVRINRWWQEHPDLVLGETSIRNGQYGPELHVAAIDRSTGATAERFGAALRTVAADTGEVWSVAARPQQPVARMTGEPDKVIGHLEIGADGIVRSLDAAGTYQEVGKKLTAGDRIELAALLDLRDRYIEVISAEAADATDSPQLTENRAALRDAVDEYHRTYGPINRYTAYLTGKAHPETGERSTARRRPMAVKVLEQDPFAVYVTALESFDDTTQTATPAAITEQRVLQARTPRDRADNPADAVALCLERHGTLERGTIAELLQIDQQQVESVLGDLAYVDPATNELIDAGTYLAGPVRQRLREATAAAQDSPAYERNVAALRAVLPRDLLPGEIRAQLGAAWIPAGVVEDFAREVFHDRTTIRWNPAGGWSVTGGDRGSVAATQRWGTEAMAGQKILRHGLAQTPPKVYDQIDSDTRVLNPVATEAAREKLNELRDHFADWAWRDPERADQLAGIYNERFNAVVLRTDFNHGHMQLPGLASTVQPRPHQLNAVGRIIAEGSAGVFHPVGYGKTATMTMALMEQRRLGLVQKPAMVVPNHMLEQASREFLQWYPGAKILAAGSEDLTKDNRRRFVARASTGDWDAIIMTRTAFQAIPVSSDTQRDYQDSVVAPMRAWLHSDAAKGEDGATQQSVKRVEKALLRYEERLKSRLDQVKDVGITWEQTGIDFLAVDELHDYKNLMTVSAIDGAAIQGSDRATDLHQKLFSLRQRHGNRVLLGATATPISNSITEMHVMLRYLDPAGLERAGVEQFDAWASTFGESVTRIELSPDGAGYREKTRFARFNNVPELMTMWRGAGDAVERSSETVAVPDLRRRDSDGERAPESVEIPASSELITLVQGLSERAARLGTVDPHEDNMLKITSEGRAAALDLRLLSGEHADHTDMPTKVEVAAARIHSIWQDSADNRYLDPRTGEQHPTPGALQLVFCDLGTPNADGRWNVYDTLRAELAGRGIPAERIALMHDAANDMAKARLFERARTGEVHVLIGSTAKMGVGTNVQTRAVALHHLDCTWKPAEMEQRDGRIVRQGNQNPEVGIYRYATKNSFDGYMYGTVARKAAFIDQVVNGSVDQREVDDISSDSTLSYEEMQAAIADNPYLVEKHQVDQEVTRLQRLRRGHQRAQDSLERRIRSHEHDLGVLDHKIPVLQAWAEQIQPTTGDAFVMTFDGTQIHKRVDAAEQLRHAIETASPHYSQPLGRLGGVDLDIRKDWTGAVTVSAAEQPDLIKIKMTAEDLGAGIGGITKLENAVSRSGEAVDRARSRRDTLQSELAEARAGLGTPFTRDAELRHAQTRQAELTEAIAELARPTDPAADTAAELLDRADQLLDTPPGSIDQRHEDRTDPDRGDPERPGRTEPWQRNRGEER